MAKTGRADRPWGPGQMQLTVVVLLETLPRLQECKCISAGITKVMRQHCILLSFLFSNIFLDTFLVYLLTHCNENPIYVFLFWELRSLSPNFHIHVSVSNLYVPRIGPHISCSRIGRSIMGIYTRYSLIDT
jgi:hypothetical protein